MTDPVGEFVAARIVRPVKGLTDAQRVKFGCSVGALVAIEPPDKKYEVTRFAMTSAGLIVALYPSEFEEVTDGNGS